MTVCHKMQISCIFAHLLTATHSVIYGKNNKRKHTG